MSLTSTSVDSFADELYSIFLKSPQWETAIAKGATDREGLQTFVDAQLTLLGDAVSTPLSTA